MYYILGTSFLPFGSFELVPSLKKRKSGANSFWLFGYLCLFFGVMISQIIYLIYRTFQNQTLQVNHRLFMHYLAAFGALYQN